MEKLKTMSYQDVKQTRELIKKALSDAENALAKFPKRPDGGHSDEVRRDPEFQSQKALLGAAFRAFQNINAYMVRNFKAEMAAERKERGYAKNHS